MPARRPDWMYRGHENYDPNRIGAISEAKVAAALVDAGMIVLVPQFQHTGRYDLVFEDEKGGLYRVQCKTGQLTNGAVFFRPLSLRAAKKETEWRRVAAQYQGQIEFFGVYCPETGAVYLVPIEDVPNKRVCCLRVEPAKNNQRKRVRWARDYEVKPVVHE